MGRTLQAYKRLFEELRARPPRRLYFLYGPEEFIKKEFSGELLRTALSGRNLAFNIDLFYGDEFDRDAFDDRLSAFPLFAERRVILLRRFEALPAAQADFVLERLTRLPDSLVVVVETSAEKIESARAKALSKLAEEVGVSFCFRHLSEDETMERVRGRLYREGLSIDPDALDLLVGSAGTNLSDVVNELEKIILAVGDDKRVTRETVTAVVGRYRTESLFSLLDQIGGKTDRTVALLGRVIDGGEEPVLVLAMILRRILQLLEVKSLLVEAGGAASPRVVTSRLSGAVSPFLAAKLVEQCRWFDLDALHLHLENFRWTDVKLKSTSLPERTLLEAALVASSLGKRLALPGESIV